MKTQLQEELALITAQKNSAAPFLLTALLCIWGSVVSPWPALPLILFAILLSLLCVIDAKTQTLPDLLTYSGIILGLVLSPTPLLEKLGGTLIGALVFITLAAVFFRVKKQHGMGYGDIKLLALIGAWLGAAALLPTLLVASLTALIALPLRQKLTHTPTTHAIAFGPFLILGAWLSLLYGQIFWQLLL